jgi:hypothetical protein
MQDNAMPLPQELTNAIGRAREALQHDEQSDLNLGYRHLIWSALGPRDAEGRHRRARLAMLAARRVLPIWERFWPHDRSPHEALALAEKVLRGEPDAQAVRQQRDLAFAKMDSLSDHSANKIPVSAGYSAVQALSAALWDESFDPHKIDLNLTDDDVQPEEHDASYFAALASSNGPPWDPNSSAGKRRQFWEWWLPDAVPGAWQGTTPNDR